ncbi:MAG: hypothetical protein K0S47_3800 [Herbinix sp.]|jgi:multimeric flavodoxin WrbA|nr:hypothetical protein [Herbinix sp.]
MRITCVSASNNKFSGDKSTSINVCHKIKEIIMNETREEAIIDIIPLKDYDIKTCNLCGACSKVGYCIYDGDFNKLLKILEASQGIFLVVPHYSPIPAKLIMIFEKINEITYAGWLNNPVYQSPFNNKAIGIIGHGGMVESEENLRYYHDHLVTPVAQTLKALSFNVVKLNDDFSNGVTFGLSDDSCLKKVDNSIFPDIIQDWTMIEERIKLIVKNVIKTIMC